MRIFTYTNAYGDQLEFSSKSDFRLTNISGLSSNQADIQEVFSAYQIGAMCTASKIQPKDITLEGDFLYSSKHRARMIKTFTPGSKGVFRVESDEMDMYLQVYVVTAPIISEDMIYSKFQIMLHASFPYWRSTKKERYEFGDYLSKFYFPASFSGNIPWRISEKHHNMITNIKNDSTQSNGFLVTFNAITDVTAPELLNIQTQEIISMKDDFVLLGGDSLSISTYPGAIRITLNHQGVEFNAFPSLDENSVFFQLMPGDNIIRYGAKENYEGLQVQLEYDHTVAGI